MFKLRNLDIGYHQNLLIGRANISFEGSKVYSVTGDNGIGKTTLLKTLNGLIRPLDGGIYLEEVDIRTMSLRARSQYFSTLFSRHEISDHIRVREIFEFSLGEKQSLDDDPRFLETIKFFKIQHLLNKFFGELSDGQKQIVLVCRLFIKKSRVYLLDEPTIYLDLKTKKRLVAFISQFKKENDAVIILISHDQSFISDISDESLLISEGIIKWDQV